MREHDTDIDSGGVQEATLRSDPDGVRTRRFSVEPGEPVDVAIVYAVAAMEGVEPTALDRPLNDVVDADALRRLFEGADRSLQATIELDGYAVRIVDGGNELIVSGS